MPPPQPVRLAVPTPAPVAPPSEVVASQKAPAQAEPAATATAPGPTQAVDLEAIKRNPLVREAAEILDASIGRVTPIAQGGK